MSDEYLWDRTGDVDPEIARLEEALRPLAHSGRPLRLPGTPVGPRGKTWRRTLIPLALAASVVLAVASLWPRSDSGSTGWMLDRLGGRVAVGGRLVAASTRMASGDSVETGGEGRARLHARGIGTLTVGPNARLRVTRVEYGRHWFALDAGSLEADITAAPGMFAVDTPSARAIDLGCRYTLDMGADGSGLLHVMLGWVALKRGDHESLVPAGALCTLRAGGGPGVPDFEGASPAFVAALVSLDRADAAAQERALAVLAAESRPLDAISLWHLLTRLDRAAAVRVYQRLTQLVPPPAGVTRDAVFAADPDGLAAWWEAIGLGELAVLRAGIARVESPAIGFTGGNRPPG